MINYEQACKKAYNHFKNISNEYVLVTALENETHWIFYGGIINVIEYGGQGIKVNKSSGAIEPFQLPRELSMLHSSSKISVPNLYKR